MRLPFVALCILGIGSASNAFSQDTIVRLRGQVASLNGTLNELDVGLFVGADLGERVVIEAHVERDVVATGAQGTFFYSFNEDGLRVTVGSETDMMVTGTALPSLQFANDGSDTDGLALLLGHSSGPVPLVDVAAIAPLGVNLWDANAPFDLQGQSFDLLGLGAFATISQFNGASTIWIRLETLDFEPVTPVGQNYCSANPNSTGQPGHIYATGSASLDSDELVLWAKDLPEAVTGFFIGSQTQRFTPGAGGSTGNLCLGGAIGRYISGGFPIETGSSGRAALPLNPRELALPTGNVSAQAGETWNFQLWHRDNMGGQNTSNFTDALAIVFG